MNIIEILKVIILGIVEGITEWLPISSTGHMIIVDEFIKLNMSAAFMEMFFVVIQLGAILAVVVIFWNKIFPFKKLKGKGELRIGIDMDIMSMWLKVIVSCLPAAVIGILFDDIIEETFYNYKVVAAMLIIYGIIFIVVERWNKNKAAKAASIEQLTMKMALIIGVFQVLALIPGTSRSGATIIGGLLIGASRVVAAEFTFYLAIPVMFGASLLKILKFGLSFTFDEIVVLVLGMATAFLVSVWAIKFLMGYIKKHDFTFFGYYRIILGIIVLFIFKFIW